MTRGVPCLRRATALAYTDADEDAERLVSFGELSSTGKEEDEWVETHAGRPAGQDAADTGDMDEIPDVDEGLSHTLANTSISSAKAVVAEDIPDIDDIPDMEEEGLEDEDDAAVAAPKAASLTAGVIDGRCVAGLALGLCANSSIPRAVKLKLRRETFCKYELTMYSFPTTSTTRHQDCGLSATTRFVRAMST